MRAAFVAPIVLIGIVALVPARAAADSNADEAEARFQRGAALYRQGKFDEALLEFFASNRLAPGANVQFNIARTYEAMQHYDEAYRYYSDYTRLPDVSAEDRATTERHLKELAPRVALLHVTSDPPGATIYVDRKDLGGRGETPLTIALPPGKHTILLERAGDEPISGDTELVRGSQVELTLRLEAIVGTIAVTATPAAEVRIDRGDQDVASPDGAALPKAPAVFALAPGRHSLELRAKGYRPLRRELVIAAHQRVDVPLVLEAIPPPAGTVVVQASIAGATVLVDGAVQGFSPAVLTLVAGTHVVAVRRDGYEDVTRRIDVADGGRQFVSVPLRRKEAEVTGATRTAQAAGDAPASVTLISRNEIDAFGYEALGDALRGVRGLYDSDDRNYRAIGIRGFSRPGDYTNRVLVLRDGHVMNDDWAGAGPVGRDFAPDLEDVARIEVVRGPGSAFYGPGAFFGVVNVVSEDPSTSDTVHAGGAVTSDAGSRVFARGATRTHGAAIAIDAGAWRSAGQTFHWDEFSTDMSRGFVANADGETAEHAALRLKDGAWSLDAGWNRRDKQLPTAPFGTVVDPADFTSTGRVVTGTNDARTFVEGRWERMVGTTRLRGRLSYDRADYAGRWPYDDPMTPFLLRDAALSQWIGGEAQASFLVPGRQRLTVGGDAAGHDVSQSVDADGDGVNDFSDRRKFVTGSLYAVDEVALGRRVALTGGVRADRSGAANTLSLSPRLAAVLTPYAGGRTKAIIGRAFRAPSVYELYYNDGGVTQIAPAPGSLAPETVWTAEIEHTHALGDRSYVLASVFGSRITGLIDLGTDSMSGLLVYQNSAESVTSAGGELEARRTWDSGAWIQGAVSYAHLSGEASARTNSSPLTALARAYWPANGESLGLAAELIYNAPRRYRDDSGSTEHVVLANLVASGRLSGDHVRFRVGVINLFDWHYKVAVGDEFVQRGVPQPGRTFIAALSYDY